MDLFAKGMGMTQIHFAIEGVLDQASERWRLLSFLRRSVILGTVVTSLVLLLGMGMTWGGLASESAVITLFVLLSVGTVMALVIIGIHAATLAEDRLRLAASLEKAHAPLMDRLNTLVALDQEGELARHPYAKPIQQQARNVLEKTFPPAPFPVSSIRTHYGILAVLVLATLLFYSVFHPWQHLKKAVQVASAQGSPDDPSLEIPPPEQQNPEKKKEPPWGEIRITKPGTNLRATPEDVVPIHIEAAANRPIANVEWVTAVSGGSESRHALEQPKESRFAVYNPELDLQKLGAGEGDVLSYYAQATCADGTHYQSDLYFIELFQEDVQPLPGGKEGPGYDLLEKLTEMIERQAEVIRQTRGQERPLDQTGVDRKARRETLAHEEADLSSTAQHVSADVEGQFEEPVAGAMSHSLEQAQSTLTDAENALRQVPQDQDLPKEAAALAALTAARKQYQEMLRKELEAVAQQAEDASKDAGKDDTKDAQREDAQRHDARLAEKLAEMQKRERQILTAREFVQKTLEAERQIEQKAASNNTAEKPQLAQRQRDLNQSMQQFAQNNRPCFGNCQKECAGAQSAMGLAANSLGAGKPDAGQRTGEAGAELQALDNALEKQRGRNQLAEAHQLKRALDRKIDQLQQSPRPESSQGPPPGSSPGSSPDGLEDIARQSKSITDRLKKIADEKPSRDWFGEPLRQALSGEKKQQIDAQCDQLGQAQGAAKQGRAAGQLQQGLKEVSRAFDASCPSIAGSKPGRSTQPEGKEALARALRQLQSMAKGQAGGRPQPGQAKLGQEALASLQASAPAMYGYNERTREIIGKLEEALKHPEKPLDVRLIQSLTEEIQKANREVAAQGAEKADESQKSYIDPSRLPPAYRKSIEKYYQKLSEQQ
jgi:hypothetical protein